MEKYEKKRIIEYYSWTVGSESSMEWVVEWVENLICKTTPYRKPYQDHLSVSVRGGYRTSWWTYLEMH